MRRIAIANQKGGCGKTTTAVNMASTLAAQGRKTLLIDLDPQGHASCGLGVDPDTLSKTIYEALLDEISADQAVLHVTKNLDLIPGNIILSAFEQQMAGAPQREYRLTQCMADLQDSYEFIFIDCPPNLGLLTFNALMYANEVLIPVDSSAFSIKAAEKLLETIAVLGEQVGHRPEHFILAANIDMRTNFGRQTVDSLRNRHKSHCLPTVIRTSTRLREAAMAGVPILRHDKNSTASIDYRQTAKALIQRAAGTARARRLREAIFTLRASGKCAVQIAGDFNNWRPQPLQLVDHPKGPVWSAKLMLTPGSYQYKYLVDGRWITDPQNRRTTQNSFGSINSVITI
jgi:chromosome partitioning protein